MRGPNCRNNDRMSSMEDLELQVMEWDERLRSIAQRPVDITRPGWAERLRVGVPPLDEAGVREEVERLLSELSEVYTEGTEERRAAVRRFFAEYRSFAWGAEWSAHPAGVDGLRQRLILFSMQDQGQDSRDALLALQGICREAVAAGVDTGPVLRAVAAWSSTANRYGLGSTRDLLLKQCPDG